MMSDKSGLPPDERLQEKIIQSRINQADTKQRGGWIGIIFGINGEKSGNIAVVVILISVISAVTLAIFLPEGGSLSKKDAVTTFTGIALSALGYIFGKNSGNSKGR